MWFVTAHDRESWRGKCASGLENAIEGEGLRKKNREELERLLLNLKQICP